MDPNINLLLVGHCFSKQASTTRNAAIGVMVNSLLSPHRFGVIGARWKPAFPETFDAEGNASEVTLRTLAPASIIRTQGKKADSKMHRIRPPYARMVVTGNTDGSGCVVINLIAQLHEPLLLNWFKSKGLSSGVVEGFNNKAKLTMRKAYGFKQFETIEVALYHQLAKLPEPKSTHKFC